MKCFLKHSQQNIAGGNEDGAYLTPVYRMLPFPVKHFSMLDGIHKENSSVF